MMKTKYHLSIFLIALFAGLMGFTTDAAAKTRLTVNPEEVIFKIGKNEEMVKISCNKKFRITTLEYPTWITLEGYNSNYGKGQQITLRAEKNTGPTRSGTVTIKTTEGDVKIKVTQYAPGYAIEVGGVNVDGDNATNITGPGITGQVSFDPATNTLTLNNATIQREPVVIYDINKDGILTIKLQGRNTIKGFVPINILHRPLRISGGGTLTIDAGNVSIYNESDVSIENCTLNANRRMKIYGELQINNSNVYVIDHGVGVYDVLGNFTLMGCRIVHPAGARIKSVIGVGGRSTTVVDASGNVCTEVRISTSSTEPEQPATLTLDPKELTVEAKGGEHKVTITSTQTIGPMDFVGPDWIIRYSYPPGSHTSKVVDLTFEPNTGAERTGEITIKTTAGNVKLKVTQRGASSTPSGNLTLDPKELTVEADRNYPKVKISCNEEFLFQGVDGLDWVSLGGNTGNYEKATRFRSSSQRTPA
ncbi:MAG: BACON domain-containing protein, partial [Prevotella denticola]